MFAPPDEIEAMQRDTEELVARHRIGARVHVLEPCRDRPAALMLADVVAVPAAEPEPFSLAIAEAQAMGRPVVAAAHGAAIEQVQGQPMGWLVPPGDAAAFGVALSEALNLSPTRVSIGRTMSSLAHGGAMPPDRRRWSISPACCRIRPLPYRPRPDCRVRASGRRNRGFGAISTKSDQHHERSRCRGSERRFDGP
jgi:glycosyltransferase involved in cell wall biosynthesis